MILRSELPADAFARTTTRNVSPERGNSAASFARIGHANPDAVSAQHRENRRRAEEDGFVIVAELTLDGFRADEPAYEEFVRFVNQGRMSFSRVYMRDRTRVARFPHPGVYDAFSLMYKDHGMELVCLSDASEQDKSVT